jgi:hypothetical protein
VTESRFRISRVGRRSGLWIPKRMEEHESRLLAERLVEFCESPHTATVLW